MNGCNEASTVPTSSISFESSQRLKFHGTTSVADNHGDVIDAATLHPRIINKVVIILIHKHFIDIFAIYKFAKGCSYIWRMGSIGSKFVGG